MKFRACLLLCLAACSHDARGFDAALSGGTGGTGVWEVVDRPDLGLQSVLEPDRLDLPPQDLCGSFDILFVIDNSGSMSDDQERLAASVPGFVESLSKLGVGANGGLHVGVVTTDNYRHNEPEDCRYLGHLVTSTVDPVTDEPRDCGPFVEGNRFMTEADDFASTLPCALQPGSDGSGSERPIDAAIEALDGWTNRPGACNEGFHRKGDTNGDFTEERSSLLVILITDEDDTDSIGPVDEWVEHLEFVRDGTLEDAAFIALIPADECVGIGSNQDPFKLTEFLEAVPYSMVGNLCEDDYAEFFVDAVPFVAAGCGLSWDPEG